MSSHPVCINNVTYRYPNGETAVLQSLSLRVKPGEVVAIMGATGVGKTTLALLCNGLIPHFHEGEFSGEVLINDIATHETNVQELVNHVGLVLQDSETQIFGISVLEDTAFGPQNLGLPKEEILRRVDKSLAQVGLTGYEERLTSNLSGGEKQRLALAGVLAMEPTILVLDEPASELDPNGRLDILDAIQQLRAVNQTTVVFIDHQAESVLQLADHLVVIGDGSVCWSGTPEGLFQNVALTKQFAIRPPAMAELGEQLRDVGILTEQESILTLDEAEAALRQCLTGKQLNFPSQKVRAQELCSSQFDSENHNPTGTKFLDYHNNPDIEINGLSHTYPSNIEALTDISCQIKQGELVAIIGQNGAGKSTLVKHLNGLLQPSAGTVKINGVDTCQSSVPELAKQVGYVFQNPDHQIFSATVAEELQFGLKNLGLSEAEQETRVTEALEFVGLLEQRERHPFTLSKGERQKIAVASILAVAPPIICIDEPTTGLDWRETQQMIALIRHLHDKGHTVLMITHQMELVAEMAERVLVMNQGRLQLDGAPSEIFRETAVLQACGIIPPPLSQLVARLSDLNLPQNICTVSQFVQAVADV